MKFRTILPLALVAALLAGCAEDDAADIGGGRQAGGAGEPVALTIAPESVTRTVTLAGNAWEGGEEVAVSIGGTVKKYVVGADKSTLSPASGVTPFYWTASTMDIEAWYPYADTKPTVTVPADQSTTDKFRAAIMLEASVTDAPLGPVALTFNHCTAMVTINAYDLKDGWLKGDLVLLTNLSGVSSGTTIKTYKRTITGDYDYFYALVAPQTVAANTSLLTICRGGDVWTYKHNAAVNLQAGGYESIAITYNSATRPAINGHKYVEMGDGKKWATCNVGATNPQDYGDYFQWGATVPYYQAGYSQESPCTHWIDSKSGYDWANYSFMEDGQSDWKRITKYTFADNQKDGTKWYDGDTFIGDGKTSFADYGYADDAARANWGGTWRTPTDAEWTWLRENCNWEWTGDYLGTGVKGMIVTSKVTGYTSNSIFLPAAGYRFDAGLYLDGSGGYYWSSSLYEYISDYARDVYFESGVVYRDDYSRYWGQSVRPVSN